MQTRTSVGDTGATPVAIDFVVIGAAKAASTSLHHYLSAHPGTFVPRVKEIAFFSDTHLWDKGTDWYFDWFENADGTRLTGEVSPQYMRDDITAERMHQVLPHAKLIVSLRNPIDRLYSHYRHAVVEGNLQNSVFGQLIDQQLAGHDSSLVREFRELLRYGEYGRILTAYLRLYPREQIRVVQFDDLVKRPRATIDDLCAWLGLSGRVPDAALDKRHNVGGALRYPRLGRAVQEAAVWANRQPLLRAAAVQLVSRQRLRSWWWWFRKEFNRKRVPTVKLTSRERTQVARYYADDVRQLEELLGEPMPWPEFH